MTKDAEFQACWEKSEYYEPGNNHVLCIAAAFFAAGKRVRQKHDHEIATSLNSPRVAGAIGDGPRWIDRLLERRHET